MSRLITIVALDPKRYKEEVPILVSPRLDDRTKDLLAGDRRFKTEARRSDRGKEDIYYAVHEVLSDDKTRLCPMELTDSTIIPLRYGEVLNLDDPKDALIYAMLSALPVFVANKSQWNPGDDMQRCTIDDPMAEARQINTHAKKMFEAMKALEGMTAVDRVNLAFFLGQPAHVLSSEAIDAFLYETAQKTPEKVTGATQTSHYKYRVLLRRSVGAQILAQDGNAFKNGETVLGIDEDHATAYLADPHHQSFTSSLIDKLNEKEGAVQRAAHGPDQKKNNASPPIPNDLEELLE